MVFCYQVCLRSHCYSASAKSTVRNSQIRFAVCCLLLFKESNSITSCISSLHNAIKTKAPPINLKTSDKTTRACVNRHYPNWKTPDVTNAFQVGLISFLWISLNKYVSSLYITRPLKDSESLLKVFVRHT